MKFSVSSLYVLCIYLDSKNTKNTPIAAGKKLDKVITILAA